MLVATLKAAKVSGAAALADAAIGESCDETDVTRTPFLSDDAPWPERVDGATLLDTLVATVRRYVVLPDVHAARAMVLWIVLTYCEASVNVLPLLLVTSPTKRCGKTRCTSSPRCVSSSSSAIRLAGKWRAYRQQRPPKPVRPGTVNRELDTLRAILTWAVKDKKLVESPAAGVEHLHTDNRRLRVLTLEEQRALLTACQRHRKLAVLVELLLITGARVGEFLALTWADWTGDELHFLHTKNGTVRRVQVTSRMRELLESLPRRAPYVFTNSRTGRPPHQHIRKVFGHALERAGIRSGDVSPHTLRHTAITRMRLAGIDDATIMEVALEARARTLTGIIERADGTNVVPFAPVDPALPSETIRG